MAAVIRVARVAQGLQSIRRSPVCQNLPIRSHHLPKRSLAFHNSKPVGHLRSNNISRRVIMARSPGPALARLTMSEPLAAPPSGAKKYKIALCQLSVVVDKSTNIAHAREVIEAVADNGAQLIVLPEMWNCPYSNDSFPIYAEDTDGLASAATSSAMLADVAQQKGVTIIGGSIPESSNGRLYNSCYIFGKNGELKGKHRKSGKILGTLGLTVEVEMGGQEDPEFTFDSISRSFQHDYGTRSLGASVESTAVNNQFYVVACSPARDNSSGYIAWGHSTIVGPFGDIIATTEEKEATIYGEIDYLQVYQTRLNMPLDSQRRGDLYALIDKSRK